ncbi:MAG: TrkA family potassium uptake protein [Fimbriimonadales bacterium]|nr:TrkA family potassium uptake protein [Fimbriimonadales bacterium]
MKVIVFGCGRTGTMLSLELAHEGHEVTIIEMNPSALRRLGRDHKCRVVIGSGLDSDVLESAGIQEADAFFALTRGDNTNLMSAQIAKLRYRVAKVCVKVADPRRAEAYRNLGYFCITPSALTAGMMRDWILGREYEKIDTYNKLSDVLKS